MNRPVLLMAAVLLLLGGSARAQTRIMPLGDSITHGGQSHVSYRYVLWFDLAAAGADVDLVGRRDFTNDGSPNLAWYPDYFNGFDRDHEGYWGWRTDEIAGIVVDAATAGQPDFVLIHLGTNDIGQMGAAGVTNADVNLRLIIDRLRSVRPDVVILLAQVIPIGPGTSYFDNAAQVGPLNAVIATIAGDLHTTQSPVVLVDQNSGFDLGTMMQADGLHPNLTGEAEMADVWQTELAAFLPVNPPPTVTITAPPGDTDFTAPDAVPITAEATDPNGFIAEVRFFAGAALLGVDTTPPFEWTWHGAPVGNHVLTAQAEDDEGATRTSAPVGVAVRPPAGGISLALLDPSFETPVLDDGALAPGPGTVGSWSFAGTPNTFVGIFNPPAGSYPEAEGNGTPPGADGANVAYLFNNGGPDESVSASQAPGLVLEADSDYFLTVAIGRFLPDQPYAFSTFGGYRIELLGGGAVIASAEAVVDPPTGEFRDAVASVYAHEIDPGSIGQPLSIRLDLSTTQAPRSSHFDDVRLVRHAVTGAGSVPSGGGGAAMSVAKTAGQITLDWDGSCVAGDTDYAVYEGAIGNFASHVPRLCSTAGLTGSTLMASEGDRYYLVVPLNGIREGSYGRDSLDSERPAAATPCLHQRIDACP